MSGDRVPGAAVEDVFDRCDHCNTLLNPHRPTHNCDANRRHSTTSDERAALRAADDRPPETQVVVQKTNKNGASPAYHARHAPSGAPEPACQMATRYDGPWVERALRWVPLGAYPCRRCFPEFGGGGE